LNVCARLVPAKVQYSRGNKTTMAAAADQLPIMKTKTLPRRHLKPIRHTSTLVATTKQNTLQAASDARETAYSIPFLTQNGVEFFDVVDPCSLLASNDDPRVDQQIGIEGLDWSQMDMALLANCTSMPSSAPSYVGHDGSKSDRDEVFCGVVVGTDNLQSVVVKYVYKVETLSVSTASEVLPELEGKLLDELQNSLCGTANVGLVSIESFPEDVEIATGKTIRTQF
jgi:hypothetical protein